MTRRRVLLRWAALPITDRRWAAPLSALALGFGVFVGVAIGPGAASTVATGAARIVAIPGSGQATSEDGEGRESGSKAASASPRPRTAAADAFPPEASAAPSLAPFPAGEPESPPASESPVAPPPEPQQESTSRPNVREEESVSGVVVHRNRAAGSYVVAAADGALAAVHAPTAPRLGTRVEAPVRTLANGTYAEAGQRVRSGAVAAARIRGTVTFVSPDPAAPSYVVSARGVSMLVRVPVDPAAAPPALPALAGVATVAIEMRPEADSTGSRPVVWQAGIEAGGPPRGHADFSGIAVDARPESGELVLSADDAGESGGQLLFAVPAEIDLTRVRAGDSLLVTATIGPGGTLAATGLAADELAQTTASRRDRRGQRE